MTSGLANRTRDALFLAYHSISPRGPDYLTVPPETFERQLATLRSSGYRSGDRAALRTLASGGAPGGRHAFLTFDDGYEDNYTTALPLLREYGFTAWVFVLPPVVESQAALDWPEVADAAAAYPEVMRSVSWTMIEEMAAAGLEIGSHGLRHSHLPRLGDEELTEELWQSRVQIKGRLGRCDSFAYPFGEWDARLEAAAARAGYSFAFTSPSAGQRRAGPLTVPRVPVDARDRSWRFRAKLTSPGRIVFLSRVRPMVRKLRASARLGAGPRR